MTTVAIPRAAEREPARVALLGENRVRALQAVLFVMGAVLMPLGLVVIGIGWYGAAHTPYEYDQISYLISGGMLGLGLTVAGGFLYFGGWLAASAADQRESARRLSQTMLALTDVLSRMQTGGTVLVAAGDGSTVHRLDCPLVAHRGDLERVEEAGPDLTPCRVCRPLG